MTKLKEIIKIIFEKKEEDVKVKVKWSLKKKVLVGLGILGTSILGIFAYGKKHAEDYENDYETGDYEDDYETDETEVENDINGFEDEVVETEA